MKLQKRGCVWVVLKDDIIFFSSESFEIAHSVAYNESEVDI